MKPAVPMEHDPEVFIRDIKSLNKQREKIREDVERLKVEFERKEKSLALKYEDKSVALNRSVIELQSQTRSLGKELETTNEKILLRSSELRSLNAAHENLSQQMSREMKEKEMTIASLNLEISSLEEIISSLSIKKTETLDDISVLETRRDDVGRQLRGVEVELESVQEKIDIGKRELIDIGLKINQFRKDVLDVNEKKKELGMKLHDVRILEKRLQPEFKKAMGEYLKTHHYAVLD